ncbi:MAG: hypothetical protein SO135_06060 [Sphaerochaetaceae bacterium]|nr:hypothetical protein [Sphaerochaetaceae bacterium]
MVKKSSDVDLINSDSDSHESSENRRNRFKESEELLAAQMWPRYKKIIDENKGSNLVELCRESDFSYKTLTNQISDNRMPKVAMLIEMARNANTSIDYLLFGDDTSAYDKDEIEVLRLLRTNSSFREIVFSLKSLSPNAIRSLNQLLNVLYEDIPRIAKSDKHDK